MGRRDRAAKLAKRRGPKRPADFLAVLEFDPAEGPGAAIARAERTGFRRFGLVVPRALPQTPEGIEAWAAGAVERQRAVTDMEQGRTRQREAERPPEPVPDPNAGLPPSDDALSKSGLEVSRRADGTAVVTPRKLVR